MFEPKDVQPMRDLVLVRRLQPEMRTKGGIWLGKAPDLGDSTRAVVLNIGPRVTDVRIGDMVKIGPWSDLLCIDDEHAILPEEECRLIEGMRKLAILQHQTKQVLKALSRA